LVALLCSLLGATIAFGADTPPTSTVQPTEQETTMQRISGEFELKMSPEPGPLDADGIGRFRLDKRYSGPLQATGIGLMTAHRTATEGSAGYVAIERVRGSLDGRSGSFVIQHNGLMWGETRQLTIEVIPDSGDGELTGLRGRMDIRIEGGKHYYDFEYALPAH
jgi:hypothetical protein